MFGYHKMNRVERSRAEWNGVKRNEDFIQLFGNFRTELGKFFIPPRSEGKKYGGM